MYTTLNTERYEYKTKKSRQELNLARLTVDTL